MDTIVNLGAGGFINYLQDGGAAVDFPEPLNMNDYKVFPYEEPSFDPYRPDEIYEPANTYDTTESRPIFGVGLESLRDRVEDMRAADPESTMDLTREGILSMKDQMESLQEQFSGAKPYHLSDPGAEPYPLGEMYEPANTTESVEESMRPTHEGLGISALIETDGSPDAVRKYLMEAVRKEAPARKMDKRNQAVEQRIFNAAGMEARGERLANEEMLKQLERIMERGRSSNGED